MPNHQTAYKCTERIDPKIKRRLRRSQEWQNKRDEMVNRRRKIGVMSPCTEFDLSINSPVSENASKIPEDKENKKIARDNKKQQQCNERIKMLQKWKEEKDLQRKQAALEKGKCKPFVVAVSRASTKSLFDIKWEQKLQKKQVKTAVPPAESTRKTRAGLTASRSVATTTTSTTTTTRATTRAKTRQADVTHKPKPSSSVLPVKKAPVTRQPARFTSATESKKAPLAPQPRVTRQSNKSKVATKSTARILPSTKTKTTTSVSQKQKKTTKTEPPVKDTSESVIPNEFDTLPPKVTTRSERQTVSFVPGNFVFTAPENLQAYSLSSSLSPNSTESFFFDGFNEPPSNIIGSTNSSDDSVDTMEKEVCLNVSETVEESEAPEKQDKKCLETTTTITTTTTTPFTPVRNDVDVATFKTPVSSISLKSKKNRPSYSDTKPSNKKKSRKSLSCHKMDSTKVPKSPEEWVELLKNSPMIEMTRRKIPKHQLDQIPTFSLEDDCMRTALKENYTTSDGQRAAEMVDQEAPVMESLGDVKSETQERTEATVVTQEAPVEADTKGVAAVADTQEASAEADTQQTTAEADTKGVAAEADTQETTAEAHTQEASATMVVPQDAAETQETPAVVPQEAPETITMETPVTEPREMETVTEEEVMDVPQEVAETVTQDASGTVTLEATVTTPKETVETATQESAEAVSQEVTPDESSQMNAETVNADTEHNVLYFRNLVDFHTKALNNLSDAWGEIVPTEEAEGEVRTVIGQAKLLISQRFRQFIGLVDNCEFNTGEKETTCEDLQGFWDMVDFQVINVKKSFADLQKLKDNNWQAEDIPVTKPVKKIKKIKPGTSKMPKVQGKSKFAKFLAQKKLLNNSSTDVDLNEAEKQEPVKVFDGHFFKVESPVRSPKPHCLDSPRSPIVIPVFTDTTRERSADIQANIHEKGNQDDKTFQTIEKEPKDEESEMMQPVDTESRFDSMKATPLISRRSYVPAIPSPLLQDITPLKKRESTSRRSRLLAETADTPDSCRAVSLPAASVENAENDQVFVLQSPPRTRRRSQRVSRRLSAIDSLPKSPSNGSENNQGSSVPIGQLVDLAENASPNCESSTEKKTPSVKRRSRAKMTPGDQSGNRRSTRIARLSVFHVEPCSTRLENHPDMNLIDFQTPMTSKRKSVKRSKSVVFADCLTEEEENCSTPAGDLTTVLCPVSPNVDCTLQQKSSKLPRFGNLKVGYTPIRSRQNRRSSQLMDEEN